VIYDGEIPVPATNTVMMMNTRITAQTSNPSGEVQVSITDNKGTVAFGGRDPVSVFIYKRIPWPDIGLTLFAGMGASDGAWSLFWVYCDAAGKLTQFYGERTDSPATTNVLLQGACNETPDFWEMPVDLPALSLRDVPLTCGFTVSAPSSDVPLDLGSSRAGTATIDGLAATALVFSTTDCRTSCGRPAWFELHSILWRPDSGQVGFAIWYLAGTTSGQGVSAANGIILPESGWTDILHSRATWSLDR
jgi:hypothetical protein